MDVYLFGAGASAAAGAPATADFFARAWQLLAPDFDDRVKAVWRFLSVVFAAELSSPDAFALIPAVDDVVSLVDWSLHVNQGLGFEYDPPHLYQVRRDLEHLLCATLDAALESRPQRAEGAHARFVRALLARGPQRDFALISLNYDTLLDDALVDAGAAPDYGFRDVDLAPAPRRPLLAKLHGSLNWGVCPSCGRVAVADGKVAHLLPHVEGLCCTRCGNDRLHSLIISPTWLKSYASVHLQHVWDLALECVQRAGRLIFVGYSLPPADIAIYHLLRRGLLLRTRGSRPRITVINHTHADCLPDERCRHEHEVMAHFTRLFGRGVDFDFSGFHGQI